MHFSIMAGQDRLTPCRSACTASAVYCTGCQSYTRAPSHPRLPGSPAVKKATKSKEEAIKEADELKSKLAQAEAATQQLRAQVAVLQRERDELKLRVQVGSARGWLARCICCGHPGVKVAAKVARMLS